MTVNECHFRHYLRVFCYQTSGNPSPSKLINSTGASLRTLFHTLMNNKEKITLKASTICVAGSFLFSVAANAAGNIPVFELDFTRSADQTLKKLNITDAFIVAAPDPITFTYCREGSTTLWKYQVANPAPPGAIHVGARQPQMETGQISILEIVSEACLDDMEPDVRPVMTCRVILGLAVLFLLIGLQYTYQVIRQHYDRRAALSDPLWLPPTHPVPAHHAMAKALGALSFTVLLAIAYCCCSVL